jgi:hypothetical protein
MRELGELWKKREHSKNVYLIATYMKKKFMSPGANDIFMSIAKV